MSKTMVSRCTIKKKKNNDNLYVKVKNQNLTLSRQITINAYTKDSSPKEFLPVYIDDQPAQQDTLEPEAEKVYRIDVSNIEGKVKFEIIQKKGSTGIKVSRNNKNSTSVEIQLK
ncbi:hypothetical protein JOC86_004074 [Bacillus pakistanensis]|uniref:Uncharacterized protein n=1 Tax=Rossellomorea pakistanensis TaxID=992288 RepID=A0ABS2NIY7_9BACI|nr:hypothetical protein [Bacillus pakistanensis]MBM7587501.1 hypothetical protein [Bacillus pakistanensis]